MATAPTADPSVASAAAEVVRRCRRLAEFTQEPGWTTRTFLSAPMRQAHAEVRGWMASAGMSVSIDAAGNLRGVLPGASASAPRLYIGSHLDTVPRAGAFDGILGVIAGIAVVELLKGTRLPCSIEVVGCSDEEGVRFGVPFIGSRALAGTLDRRTLEACDIAGISVAEAIRQFGLNPDLVNSACIEDDAIGWLELHIEQGPVLDSLKLPLGVVPTIAGQTRMQVTFTGAANHAGTTPMTMRRDALAAASEWVLAVERDARAHPGSVATVGQLEVEPGAGNVIAGRCRASLDLRHELDSARTAARDRLVAEARSIGERRGVVVTERTHLEQPAVALDAHLTSRLADAVSHAGLPVHRLASGAGHDAMILATRMPAAMLFVRSPGGISHHPDETVVEGDVAAALKVLRDLVIDLALQSAGHNPRG